jgi:hypothetical protein
MHSSGQVVAIIHSSFGARWLVDTSNDPGAMAPPLHALAPLNCFRYCRAHLLAPHGAGTTTAGPERIERPGPAAWCNKRNGYSALRAITLAADIGDEGSTAGHLPAALVVVFADGVLAQAADPVVAAVRANIQFAAAGAAAFAVGYAALVVELAGALRTAARFAGAGATAADQIRAAARGAVVAANAASAAAAGLTVGAAAAAVGVGDAVPVAALLVLGAAVAAAALARGVALNSRRAIGLVLVDAL